MGWEGRGLREPEVTVGPRVVNFIPLPGRTQVLLGSGHSGADSLCGLLRINGR